MLGVVILGTLALAGSSGPMWWSDLSPQAGKPYAAISYTGTDTFGCGGSISRQPVRATTYKIDNTTICVLYIPKGTAGKTLFVGFSVSGNSPQGLYVADGAAMRKVIRR